MSAHRLTYNLSTETVFHHDQWQNEKDSSLQKLIHSKSQQNNESGTVRQTWSQLVNFLLSLFPMSGGEPVTMPTSWSDFPSHAGVPKLIPNPLAVDNVSLQLISWHR